MTKEEALYQVKLILECLDFEEYRKIPDETWDYIENNMEYNENIVIDPEMPLEKQNIDPQAKIFLKQVLKQIEEYKEEPEEEEIVDKYEEYKGYSLEELYKLVDKYKKESEKVPKAKALIKRCESAIKQNISEVEDLKKTNEELMTQINKCPKVIKFLFFRNIKRNLLSDSNKS